MYNPAVVPRGDKTREMQKRGTLESSQERNAEPGDFTPMGLECKYCAQA